tara:strand:- start:32111 stop:33412 length:1302 start_codon:yes stop_codon:yes gene_type:complete
MTKLQNNDQIIPEKSELKIGFIPLTDCCVLAVAKEMGFFEKHGLSVSLSKEASWANIRDKVSVGALDAAQMLAGMPIVRTLGLSFTGKPMLTAFSMDLNGNAITVSNELYERLYEIDKSITSNPENTAKALKQLIELDKLAGKPMLTFATVYPFSNHNYELRYWMASAGIDPEQDVRLMVIPPQYMVSNLEEGRIDGFCVGEPWNSNAVYKEVGKILITGYEVWNNSPEKVLGVMLEWAERYPNTHLCLLMALMESAIWIDNINNRKKVVEILANEKYIGISEEIVRKSIDGTFEYRLNGDAVAIPDFNVFHRYQANFPWRSHASWIISQMYRWGQLKVAIDIKKTVESIYRPDIYRQAARQLNILCPTIDYKTEGEHEAAWFISDDEQEIELGADKFIDGKVFDPNKLVEYTFSFDVNHIPIEVEQLNKTNQ